MRRHQLPPPDLPPPPFPDPQSAAEQTARINFLLEHRRQITSELLAYLTPAQLAEAVRPVLGPCTRCDYLWRGKADRHPPIQCPRCHSSFWQAEPQRPNARRPDDPPNPTWALENERKNSRRKTIASARMSPSALVLNAIPPPPRADLAPPVPAMSFVPRAPDLDPPQPEHSHGSAPPVEPEPDDLDVPSEPTEEADGDVQPSDH